MKIQAYLSFRGNCQEALNFYQDIFGGEIINTETWENKGEDIPADYKNKWQHAELKGKGFHFMAYDVSPDTVLNTGNTVCMSIDCDDESEGKKVFDQLSAQGRVHTNWQEMSWGAKYGRCSDQFDIQWMVNAK
ncbi:MAG: VOC family protein [Nonlabens sp.]